MGADESPEGGSEKLGVDQPGEVPRAPNFKGMHVRGVPDSITVMFPGGVEPRMEVFGDEARPEYANFRGKIAVQRLRPLRWRELVRKIGVCDLA